MEEWQTSGLQRDLFIGSANFLMSDMSIEDVRHTDPPPPYSDYGEGSRFWAWSP